MRFTTRTDHGLLAVLLIVAGAAYVTLLLQIQGVRAELAHTKGSERSIRTPGGATHVWHGGPHRSAFSAAFSPVLRINPGDQVQTTTLDNMGFDSVGGRPGWPPNPQTGPFYVAGAQPGDVLVVTLDELRLNRTSAHGGTRIVPHALTADYSLNARYEPSNLGEWVLDLEHRMATLRKPPARLRHFRVPLRPMLGGIAVAPPGDHSYPTTHLGSWGGNLDYAAIERGTVVYLPIYHPGALLFIGDGHAAQGDGELANIALETSLDVVFTVDIIESVSIDGPLARTRDHLLSMGIGRTYSEAVRRATTGLLKWLEREYRLTPDQSAVVVSTTVQLDIAEIVDPQINVVAKIPTSVLASLNE
jgi:acetamidase/formamidase